MFATHVSTKALSIAKSVLQYKKIDFKKLNFKAVFLNIAVLYPLFL
jgi:hypothetical protein